MITLFNAELHYEIFKKFSLDHRWPIIPIEMLSPVGFVYSINEVETCFVFVYETVGSNWAIMEWMIVSTHISKNDRNESIEGCIKAAKAFAKSKNLVLFTSCKGDKLKNRYRDAGFVETDHGMTNLIFKGE